MGLNLRGAIVEVLNLSLGTGWAGSCRHALLQPGRGGWLRLNTDLLGGWASPWTRVCLRPAPLKEEASIEVLKHLLLFVGRPRFHSQA